ncbi:hypothetical protein IMG5_121200 [Ichthyophthirius multifiliis]|uniref:Uncharacterized protein n=1 Tax=Ichthyophthirius multifiliis TaxID=5932 RepID=G0QV42_ICHMU|nr:hypothetical protein IMG5_121200 [Ichthyophthirius multifiliis]EGR30916.1 hypothetical protein IMG5_121200 [Ichthyophthirius multifiliis]|eukprot:XP_004032503.1 hypothetical protein IMG5_121200 [Ichthyophthirius multifiliis]
MHVFKCFYQQMNQMNIFIMNNIKKLKIQNQKFFVQHILMFQKVLKNVLCKILQIQTNYNNYHNKLLIVTNSMMLMNIQYIFQINQMMNQMKQFKKQNKKIRIIRKRFYNIKMKIKVLQIIYFTGKLFQIQYVKTVSIYRMFLTLFQIYLYQQNLHLYNA